MRIDKFIQRFQPVRTSKTPKSLTDFYKIINAPGYEDPFYNGAIDSQEKELLNQKVKRY